MRSGPVGTVVPSHHARFLRECLRSLVRQTVPHDILVVDDGSHGGESGRVARELGVPYVRNTSSLGGAAARNIGIEALGTPWVLNFDHDNVAEPRLVERLLRAATGRSGVGVAYCTPRQIGMAHGPHPGIHRSLRASLAEANFIDASSLFAREAWREAGGFDAGAGPYADWDLWLGMVERGWRIAYVPEMLYRYRLHESSHLRSAGEDVFTAARRYVREKHRTFVRRAGRPTAWRLWTERGVSVRRNLERGRLERDRRGPMKIVLIGARHDGQAGVVLDAIAYGLPYQVVAFLDETKELWGSRVEGIPVYGGPAYIDRALEQGATGGMVSIGDPAGRQRLAGVLRDADLEMITMIHPTAFVAASAWIGAGTFIGPLVGVSAHCRLGELSFIQGSAYIGHDAHLGPATTLAPGVAIGGRCRIGERAFLGLGAVVLPDVTIGDDAVVGAGAVVREDVAPGTTVVGVPARSIHR